MNNAETWVDYQTPSEAHINLFALYGYEILRWHPKAAVIVRGKGNNTEYVYGHPYWSVEEWIEQFKINRHHLRQRESGRD